MGRLSLSRSSSIWATALLVLTAGAAGIFWVLRGHSPPSSPAASHGFRDEAAESGLAFAMKFLPGEQGEKFKINLYDHGCGVAVGDYDGDGHDDIFFCNQLGRCALYRNRGDGTFEDVTDKAGVGLGDRICVAATFADYDNDGHQDLFVTSTRGGDVLFHNQGDGTFKDVTREAGVSHIGHSQTAVFFDYDNDGYLDLLVTNSGKWTIDEFDDKHRYWRGVEFLPSIASSQKEYNILYHNNGNGTFTDVTAKAGLKGRGWAGDIAVFDYNEDGHFDVLITSMFGRSQLYRNDGNGTFTDVTLSTLGRTPFGAVGARVFDLDNDGRLALYIVDMHSDMWMDFDSEHRSLPLALRNANKKNKYFRGPSAELSPNPEAEEKEIAHQFGYNPSEVIYGNALYRNLGKGKSPGQWKFEEISDKAGMETFWPWSVATGDFDNDGHEDVFLAAGMGYPFWYWPNSLMMNNGDGTFTDRAKEFGIEPPARGRFLPDKIGGKDCPRSSRCAAVADFDGDGRLDIVVNNFNDHPYYFRNHLPKKNYIAFKLRGTSSNRDAIGAVLRLHSGKEVMTRQVNPAGGYLVQSSKTIHFGLGDRTTVDKVEIVWPRGRKQTLTAPQINKLHPLDEPTEQGD
jgi:hypothetical protein